MLAAAQTRLRALAWRARGGRAPAEPGFRILSYHRVSDDRDELAVEPARFRSQMEALAAEGWRGVDVLTAVGAAPGAVGLAFDDGYLDVAEHALPELERHGFTATVFLATGVTDGRVALTRYRAGGQPPLLTWEEISRLDGGSLRFEAHTITHPDLRAVDDARARDEIEGSKAELEQRLGRPVSVFCYPYGRYGPREVGLVSAAGYRAACTCEPGLNNSRVSPLELRRIRVDAHDSVLDFRAKLGGGFD